MTSEFRTLETRLEQVERENRRIKWIGGMVLLALAALLVKAEAPRSRVIDAEAFTLVGARGEPRAVLAMIQNEPTLAFFDNAGKVREALSVVDNMPRIILYGEDGSPLWEAP